MADWRLLLHTSVILQCTILLAHDRNLVKIWKHFWILINYYLMGFPATCVYFSTVLGFLKVFIFKVGILIWACISDIVSYWRYQIGNGDIVLFYTMTLMFGSCNFRTVLKFENSFQPFRRVHVGHFDDGSFFYVSLGVGLSATWYKQYCTTHKINIKLMTCFSHVRSLGFYYI